MNRINTLLVAVFLTIAALAQTPQKISYQSVIRDSGGKLVSNKAIGLRISILQGSVNGTTVYSETQIPASNANGLVSVEIGNGNSVLGSISTINWSSGVYFIKTETDPNGGVNYSINGISQILAVPYAMYAEKAGNGFSGNYADLKNKPAIFSGKWADLSGKPSFAPIATGGGFNDLLDKPNTISGYGITDAFNGTWASLSGKPNFAKVATSGSYADLSNTPITNGSETKVTAGVNISVTGTGTSDMPYVVSSNGFTHYIGELYQGGIIVSVWKANGIEHGLIASLKDICAPMGWCNNTSTLIGITARNLKNGLSNSNAIVAQAGHTLSAASRCFDYISDGYDDWYLPAVWELNQCYNAAIIVNEVLGDTDGFQFTSYWSSTEANNQYLAYTQNFSNGTNYSNGYKTDSYNVRAVRRF
jgi:hypothetical protein